MTEQVNGTRGNRGRYSRDIRDVAGMYGTLAIVSGVLLMLEGALLIALAFLTVAFSMLDDSGKLGQDLAKSEWWRAWVYFGLLPFGVLLLAWGIRVRFRRNMGASGLALSALFVMPIVCLGFVPLGSLRTINLLIGVALAITVVSWVGTMVVAKRAG